MLAFNTAVSFVTNTSWQAYGGETTLCYFSQMAGLTVQNFLSAATDIAVGIAVILGFVGRIIGNFHVDLTRMMLYLLLPLSLLAPPPLVWQGTPQNLLPYVDATTVRGGQQVLGKDRRPRRSRSSRSARWCSAPPASTACCCSSC